MTLFLALAELWIMITMCGKMGHLNFRLFASLHIYIYINIYIYISLCTVSPKLTRKKISRRQYGLEQEAAMHCLAASFFGLPATWFLRRLQAPLDGFVKVR